MAWLSATGPVDGVAASASATGTKTDTPLVETPQTVHVVPAWQVAETGARSLPDALAYTPGVSQTYGWTLRTATGVRAAHSEHTVAVTPDGARILTL